MSEGIVGQGKGRVWGAHFFHCGRQVPIALYMLTHAYFAFYHSVSNYSLRRLRRLFCQRLWHGKSGLYVKAERSPPIRYSLWALDCWWLDCRPRWLVDTVSALWIFALSYATAYMETLTISSFPYYAHTAKQKMYSVSRQPHWALDQDEFHSPSNVFLFFLPLPFWNRLALFSTRFTFSCPSQCSSA